MQSQGDLAKGTCTLEDCESCPSANILWSLLKRMDRSLKSITLESGDELDLSNRDVVIQHIASRLSSTLEDGNNYGVHYLLDHLHHLKYDHALTDERYPSRFDAAYEYFKESIKGDECDVNKCIFVQIHYRDRSMDTKQEEESAGVLMDTMAMIHCYFLHSFHINRLTKKERIQVEHEADGLMLNSDTEEDDSDEVNSFETTKMILTEKILAEKQRNLNFHRVRARFGGNDHDFRETVNVPSESKNDDKNGVVVLVTELIESFKASGEKDAIQFGDQIIAFFRENPQIDAEKMLNIPRFDFRVKIRSFCGNNKKVNGLAVKLHSRLLDKIKAAHSSDDAKTEEMEEEQKAQPESPEIHENNLNAKPIVYAEGKRFYFWEDVRSRPGFVHANHANLKEEILQSTVLDGDTNRKTAWDNTMKLVKTQLRSQAGRAIKSIIPPESIYSISSNQPLDEMHLQSLKLYTDFTKFCKKLCAVLRDGDPQKVAEIAHWARTLIETVQCFGNPMENSKQYYRGVNQTFVFNSIVTRYHLPISTTYSV